MTTDTVTPHVYRAWVDENDVGNTCCWAKRDDPVHIHPRRISVNVWGTPRPQGSMQLFKNGGSKYPKEVYVWRGQVQAAVAALEEPTIECAVELRLGFTLIRPLSHWGTGRNAHILKASAPEYPITTPDTDKLIRCVSDAITDARLWRDDAQVVSVVAAKRYGDQPGVHIVVTELL